ncbi:MAG: Nitrogen regulatory protein [Planctomycetes bacterium ADurb.Bin126]|nr:MAG: Nitrogen regulatory protein [Planctomycetes bacterium ADurb.Bin126]HQL76187.1 PTS sugar transporter subunit IIA [Phycisphaerae bacterium]
MRLRVRDAAELLNVSEKTIYRWIAQKLLPVHRVNEQYRFNRAELLEWASAQRIPVSPKMLEEPDDAQIPSLTDALRAGGIHYRVGGSDKPSALRSVVEVLPLPEEVDREFLLQVLLARESVGSTAIGEGIAIPHVRNPITLHVAQPIVALNFLENDIDFQAIDGRPVHTLFTIISPTIRAHLNLLSKLAYGLKGSPFAEAVAGRASREEIFQAATQLDAQIETMTGQAEGSPA